MAERNFNWGDSFMSSLRDPLRATPGLAPEGVMGGIDLVNSGKNVAGGQGGFLDYLTLALAPTAFAGYGIGQGVKAAAQSPQVARAIALQALRNPNIVTRQDIGLLEQMARSSDTKFKNMFEVDANQIPRIAEYQSKGIGSSNFAADEVARRAASEERVLGLPLDTPPSARPIYGVVTPAIPGLAASAPKSLGTIAGQGPVAQVRSILSPRNPQLDEFGKNQANVIFKPKKLDNVTATAGDVGAGLFGMARGAAETLGTPGVKNVADKAIVPYRDIWSAAPFLEAQMYGANLANASKVTVPTKEAQKQLQRAFKSSGLKVPVKIDRGAVKQNARKQALEDKLRKIRNQEREWEPEA